VVDDLKMLVVIDHNVLLVDNHHWPAHDIEVSKPDVGLLTIDREGKFEVGIPETQMTGYF